MQQILYRYEMTATTWVYLSSLIMISVYFKFRRFWSVRNLDLLGLILFAPGLLLLAYSHEPPPSSAADVKPHQVKESGGNTATAPALPGDARKVEQPKDTTDGRATHDRSMEQWGYLWLFVVSLFFLVRLLIDPAMVRRPLLEPNLSASGLTFACASMLVFLMSNVLAGHMATIAPPITRTIEKLPDAKDTPGTQSAEVRTILKQRGPGYPLFHVFSSQCDDNIKRATAILAHMAIVLAMVLIGYRQFDNTHTGIAAATLYLLLPYTAQYTPRIDHVVPGALLVWAIQGYRRPVVAGIFVGLAAGLTWYPLFLLPLWCSFYWRRGLVRFSVSVIVVWGLIVASLAFTPSSLGSFSEQLMQTVGVWRVHTADIHGFWEGPLAPWRYPVIVLFVAMCISMVLWPAQKNLGSLLACSAAIMLGTQFWKAYDGGTFMAWYLPLMILTILRPNLEDRVALSAISEGWVKWRK